MAKNDQIQALLWEKWKRDQVETVPRCHRKRMRELLDSLPNPPTAKECKANKKILDSVPPPSRNGAKSLREIGEEMQRMVGGKDWKKKRGQK